jgi:hypothetical protein
METPYQSFVIAGLVPAIHLSASVIFVDNSTPAEPWITGTSPVMTKLTWRADEVT